MVKTCRNCVENPCRKHVEIGVEPTNWIRWKRRARNCGRYNSSQSEATQHNEGDQGVPNSCQRPQSRPNSCQRAKVYQIGRETQSFWQSLSETRKNRQNQFILWNQYKIYRINLFNGTKISKQACNRSDLQAVMKQMGITNAILVMILSAVTLTTIDQNRTPEKLVLLKRTTPPKVSIPPKRRIIQFPSKTWSKICSNSVFIA